MRVRAALVREPTIYVQPWQTRGTGPFRIKSKSIDYSGGLRRERPLLTIGYVPRHREEDGLDPLPGSLLGDSLGQDLELVQAVMFGDEHG